MATPSLSSQTKHLHVMENIIVLIGMVNQIETAGRQQESATVYLVILGHIECEAGWYKICWFEQ